MQTSSRTTHEQDGENECEDDPWDENSHPTPSKQEDITTALSKINRANLFRKVLGACCQLPIFWNKLKDIRYVQMLTCVCKGTKELLEPNGVDLPFWGTWAPCMRPHLWKEIMSFMDVKCKHLKGLKDVSERVHEYKNNSQRVYNIQGVFEYMVKWYGGSVENYAQVIKRFRHYRKIAIKRRISFAANQLRYGALDAMDNDPKLKDEDKKNKKKRKPHNETMEMRLRREEKELKDEFSLAVCESGIISCTSFTDGGENATDLLPRIWNMFTKMREITQSYFPPKKYTKAQTCKSVRIMAMMHFCLSRHMPQIVAILTDSVNKIDQKKRIMRSLTQQLCHTMYTWLSKGHGGENMKNIVLKTLERVGNLNDPHINCIAFSDTLAYFPWMEAEMKKRTVFPKYEDPLPTMYSVLNMMLAIQKSMEDVEENVENNMDENDTGDQNEEENEGNEDPLNLLHLDAELPTGNGLQIMVNDEEDWLNNLLGD